MKRSVHYNNVPSVSCSCRHPDTHVVHVQCMLYMYIMYVQTLIDCPRICFLHVCFLEYLIPHVLVHAQYM